MAPKKRRKNRQPHFQHHDPDVFAEDGRRFNTQDEIQKRFNKKFTLKTKERQFILPESEFLFKEEPFVISELLALKEELNSTKSLLNDMDIEEWHYHTKKTHKAGLVVKHLREKVQAEMCTQAWAKLYEILCSYDVVAQEVNDRREFLGVHLCEAPGAFIASLNHYLRNNFPDLKWQWLATTLNPYYEGNDLNAMLDDDTFIIKTLENWNFGLDGTGDLMKLENLMHLKQACDSKGAVLLVTADGSINCADEPGEQEKTVGQLIFCETLAALNLLSYGGTYIFKMFTALECQMICMMYLLCGLFDEVHIIKPGTSKSGNSEVYITCVGYVGELPSGYNEVLNEVYISNSPNEALFPLKFIPEDFLTSLKGYQHFFIEMQMGEIKENIRYFHHMSKFERKNLHQLRDQVALHYLRFFNVRPIDSEDQVVPESRLDGIQRSHTSVISASAKFGNQKAGSYNQRHQEVRQTWFESVRDDEALAYYPSGCLSLKGLCQANDGMMLIPLYSEEVEWLPRRIHFNGITTCSLTYGKPISQVKNSRFCSPIFVTKLEEAFENASILTPAKSSDFAELVQQITGLSLSETSSEHKPCKFCNNSAAVVDKLVEFTRFERDEDSRTALLLNSEDNCKCFEDYLRSKDVVVQCHSSTNDPQFDFKSTEETLQENSANIVVLPYFPNVPMDSYESIRSPLEVKTKTQLLKSCIAAAKTLKQGGTFVCRIYNSFTRFTVGLFYILHHLFGKMAIVKPVIGALWHPERFLVCKNYTGRNQELIDHLERVFKAISECNSELDVLEVVDMKSLYEEKFFSFVTRMNEKHAHLQLLNIIRLESFYLFPDEIPSEEELSKLRQEVLHYLA